MEKPNNQSVKQIKFPWWNDVKKETIIQEIENKKTYKFKLKTKPKWGQH